MYSSLVIASNLNLYSIGRLSNNAATGVVCRCPSAQFLRVVFPPITTDSRRHPVWGFFAVTTCVHWEGWAWRKQCKFCGRKCAFTSRCFPFECIKYITSMKSIKSRHVNRSCFLARRWFISANFNRSRVKWSSLAVWFSQETLLLYAESNLSFGSRINAMELFACMKPNQLTCLTVTR